MTKNNYLKKSANFTDIHWGRKNNSELHNQDCLNFVKWFCDYVKSDDTIDHVIFLGDWFENRSAINGLTLKYSYEGAKLLNELDIPIFFIVGNHDLYYRSNRDVYTTYSLGSLENFTFVDEPTVFDELGEHGSLICPFMFEEEYPSLLEYSNIPVWYGHFEFKGFVLTGETFIKEHGPDPEKFSKPKRIFSGHFHKRQHSKNVSYIGNAFPADFSDANDSNRGMMIYDYDSDETVYRDWEDCPMYVKCTLSSLLSNDIDIYNHARVNIDVDVQISYKESVQLKEKFLKKYDLREFNLNETVNFHEANDVDEIETDTSIRTTTEIVINLLDKIDEPNIDNEKLKKTYQGL